MEVSELTRAFFGRASSAMKNCRKSLEVYDTARKKMQTIPKIKTHLPTVILAGFPNTGKSTILKRLTKSSPEIAHYPFTTKNLMMGYFTYKYHKIQVIDTPGLLDRPIEKRNLVEKRAISALNHLGELILFIIDPTERCGYALAEQRKLLNDMKDDFKIPFRVIINKTDIATEEEIKKAKAGLKNVILEGENVESGLLEIIVEKLKLQAPERYARKSGASKK
ncbi:MAG: GTPase [Candidatus Diapherotrites archaeon]